MPYLDPGEPAGWYDLPGWCRRFYKAWIASVPLAGINVSINQTPQGIVLSSGGGSSAVAATQIVPWQIISVGTPPGGSPLIGVNLESHIFKSLNLTDTLAVTGLLASSTPALTDPGAFAVPAIGSKIWVQIGTADPSDDTHAPQPWAGTTMIQNGAVGGGGLWDEYPDYSINVDDPANAYQEFYNLLLAEVTDFDTDNRPALLDFTIGGEHRQITQVYSKNVNLINSTVDGKPFLIPDDRAFDYLPTA